MITQELHCAYCHETDIVRHGKSPEGKQRYRCRQCLEGRGRTFLLAYTYAGQFPAVKKQKSRFGIFATVPVHFITTRGVRAPILEGGDSDGLLELSQRYGYDVYR